MAIEYARSARKDIRAFDAKTALRIREKIQILETDPQAVDVLPLKGRPGYRLRVGEVRVLFFRDGEVIVITDILPRGKACR